MQQPNADDSQELGFERYLHIALKHKMLILLVIVLVVGATAAWTYTRTPIFRAKATVLVDRRAPQVLGSKVREVVDLSAGNYWRNKEAMETQRKILSSRRMAERVVRVMKLKDNADFWRGRKVPTSRRTKALATRVLRGIVAISVAKPSNLLEIRVEHAAPKMARDIANRMAEEYIAQNIEHKLSSTSSASKWLADQLDTLRKQLESAELGLHRFKKKNNILSVSLGAKRSLIAARIEKLSDAHTNARIMLMQQRSARNQALRARKKTPLDVSIAAVNDDVGIRSLKAELLSAQRKLRQLRSRYGVRHPLMREQKAVVATTRAALEREVKNKLTSIETNYRTIRDQERRLATAVQQAKNEALELNRKEVGYRRLKRNQENIEKLYGLVLARSKESGLSGKLKVNNLRLLDAAVLPRVRAKPVVILNLAIGLAIALLLGVAVAFFVESLDTTIKSREHIEVLCGLVTLGIVPRIPGGATQGRKRRPDPSPERDLIVHHNPKSAVAESCRSIRTNLLYASPDQKVRRILVTSPAPREGKTMTATSIAIAMAQGGNSVALVDTDMRRPRLHKVFGVSGARGLSNALVGEYDLDELVHELEIPNLHLLPCGPPPPNPAELCQSASFSAVLEQLSERHDYVILDTPPIMAVTDAAILSTLVDAVLLVVRTASTSSISLQQSVRQLRDIDAPLLGCVLNDMDQSTDRYGYTGYKRYGRYRYSYDYYGETEKNATS